MNDKLTLEQMLTQAAGGTVEPAPVTDPVPPTPTPTPTPTPDATTDPEDTKKPNPMKEVRDKYNQEKATREKISTAIQKFTTGEYDFKLKDFVEDGNVNYDALITAMETADTKAKAESRGVSPEVQAELDRIEKEKVELNKQRLQISMDRALTNMQLELGLKSQDINNFFKDAMAAKKNPYQWLSQGGTLPDLYNIVYAAKLTTSKIEQAVNEARTKWEAEAKQVTRTPAPNPGQPSAQPTGTQQTGMTIAQLLEQAAQRASK